jgi:hypothetical protein
MAKTHETYADRQRSLRVGVGTTREQSVRAGRNRRSHSCKCHTDGQGLQGHAKISVNTVRTMNALGRSEPLPKIWGTEGELRQIRSTWEGHGNVEGRSVNFDVA